MGDMFNPDVNHGRAYILYVCTDHMKHPTFESDLLLGMACFDYSVLLNLRGEQTMDCNARFCHVFVVGWPKS